jgi:hypothetical protein
LATHIKRVYFAIRSLAKDLGLGFVIQVIREQLIF